MILVSEYVSSHDSAFRQARTGDRFAYRLRREGLLWGYARPPDQSRSGARQFAEAEAVDSIPVSEWNHCLGEENGLDNEFVYNVLE
jgi:hypothetical protein